MAVKWNSQLLLYSHSSLSLYINKRRKRKVTDVKTHFQELTSILYDLNLKLQYWICRSSRPELFCKETWSLKIWKNLHENFCVGVSFKPDACNFIKKRLRYRCFFVNFGKRLRTPFLQNNSEWLHLNLSEPMYQNIIFANNTPTKL